MLRFMVSTVLIFGQVQAAIANPKLISDIPSLDRQTSQTLNHQNANPLELPPRSEQVSIPKTQSITLQEAIKLAQQNNQELQISALILKRSQAAFQQAKAALYPTVAAEAELGVERTAQGRLDDLKYLNENASPSGIFNGKVEANYDLFTFGRRPAQIQSAETQVRFDQLEVERLNQQVRLNVTSAYYAVQQADEEVRIAQAAVANAQRTLQDATALETGGIGARLDIIRARVQLGNAEQELIDAQNQQDVARRQLVQVIGLSESVNLSAADPVQIAGKWTLSLEESIVLAYKNRVELQQELAQRNISEQQRQIALAEIKPQVSLFANYQILDEFKERFGVLDGYVAGARVRWSFFDGGAARSAAVQQEVNRAIAESRFAQVRNQVRFQVEQAYKNLQANARSIETATNALKEAQEALEIIRFRFQQGVGTQLDVITAENNLTRADVNRLRAILNYNRALAELERGIGNLSVKKADHLSVY